MSRNLSSDAVPRLAVVVAIDHLHAGMVGCYGNAWIRTGVLDELASQSFLFDQSYADSTQLSEIYRGWWQGIAATSRSGAGIDKSAPTTHSPPPHSLPSDFSAAGWQTILIADSDELLGHAQAAAFAVRALVEPRVARQPAGSSAQSHLADMFSRALAAIESAAPPALLWLHVDLSAVWDSPLELRDVYADEDDPPPSRVVAAPNFRLAADADPDDLLPIVHAYAGQVGLLDECLGYFWDSLSDWHSETALVVQAVRGFPLGEHGRVGSCDRSLHNELLQQIALWRLPDGRSAAQRTGALVLPADVPGALLAACGLTAAQSPDAWTGLWPLVRGSRDSLRDRIVICGNGENAIRTPAWFCKAPCTDMPPAALYAKPSDRWEVNEIADRAPEICEQLQAVLAQSLADPAAAPEPLTIGLVTETD